MKKKLLNIYVLLCLSGCSVVAAATGSHAPDFNKIGNGSSRSEVELELGPPTRTESIGSQKEVAYTYKLGDSPAAGRALGYLALDIVTLCFAEYLLFPMEISNSGNAYEAVVRYDEKDRVISLKEKQAPQ